jgi:hypothetical protein
MSNDLLFSVLPREGKVPIAQDDQTVKRVSKEAKLRQLNDEEKTFSADEREAREKHPKGQTSSKSASDDSDSADKSEKEKLEEQTLDEHGQKHVDFYI